MKKTFLIALCSIAIVFASCKKPVEPEPIDYSTNYVGNYLGQFTLAITSMNDQATSLSFPIDSIRMNIAKGAEANTITATMTIDNKELKVAALKEGTVIDHIPSDKLFKVIAILNLKNTHSQITIGYNLDSAKLGKKAIIKISEKFLVL